MGVLVASVWLVGRSVNRSQRQYRDRTIAVLLYREHFKTLYYASEEGLPKKLYDEVGHGRLILRERVTLNHVCFLKLVGITPQSVASLPDPAP
jgi:hypothetical protein